MDSARATSRDGAASGSGDGSGFGRALAERVHPRQRLIVPRVGRAAGEVVRRSVTFAASLGVSATSRWSVAPARTSGDDLHSLSVRPPIDYWPWHDDEDAAVPTPAELGMDPSWASTRWVQRRQAAEARRRGERDRRVVQRSGAVASGTTPASRTTGASGAGRAAAAPIPAGASWGSPKLDQLAALLGIGPPVENPEVEASEPEPTRPASGGPASASRSLAGRRRAHAHHVQRRGLPVASARGMRTAAGPVTSPGAIAAGLRARLDARATPPDDAVRRSTNPTAGRVPTRPTRRGAGGGFGSRATSLGQRGHAGAETPARPPVPGAPFAATSTTTPATVQRQASTGPLSPDDDPFPPDVRQLRELVRRETRQSPGSSAPPGASRQEPSPAGRATPPSSVAPHPAPTPPAPPGTREPGDSSGPRAAGGADVAGTVGTAAGTEVVARGTTGRRLTAGRDGPDADTSDAGAGALPSAASGRPLAGDRPIAPITTSSAAPLDVQRLTARPGTIPPPAPAPGAAPDGERDEPVVRPLPLATARRVGGHHTTRARGVRSPAARTSRTTSSTSGAAPRIAAAWRAHGTSWRWRTHLRPDAETTGRTSVVQRHAAPVAPTGPAPDLTGGRDDSSPAPSNVTELASRRRPTSPGRPVGRLLRADDAAIVRRLPTALSSDDAPTSTPAEAVRPTSFRGPGRTDAPGAHGPATPGSRDVPGTASPPGVASAPDPAARARDAGTSRDAQGHRTLASDGDGRAGTTRARDATTGTRWPDAAGAGEPHAAPRATAPSVQRSAASDAQRLVSPRADRAAASVARWDRLAGALSVRPPAGAGPVGAVARSLAERGLGGPTTRLPEIVQRRLTAEVSRPGSEGRHHPASHHHAPTPSRTGALDGHTRVVRPAAPPLPSTTSGVPTAPPVAGHSGRAPAQVRRRASDGRDRTPTPVDPVQATASRSETADTTDPSAPAATAQAASPAETFAAELARHRVERPRAIPITYRPLAKAIVGDRPVRVSTSTASRTALRKVGKIAATTGDTIHLATPAPPPHVMAHELTHVAHPSPVPRFFDDDERTPEERRAEQVARIMRRAPVIPHASTPAASPAIQRSPSRGGASSSGNSGAGGGERHQSSSSGTISADALAAQITRGASAPVIRRAETTVARPPTSTTNASSTSTTSPRTTSTTSAPSSADDTDDRSDALRPMDLTNQFELILELLEERIMQELERRGGRFRGGF